jgi:ribonuclease-3 family protein
VWVYPDKRAEELPPLVLAYIGDAIYELYVRLYLVKGGMEKVNGLHKKASSLVNASEQAVYYHKLDNVLTEDEKNIARRGRNVKGSHVPKNSGVQEYRLSTGFEALVGYLFLKGKDERLMEIFEIILNNKNNDNNNNNNNNNNSDGTD